MKRTKHILSSAIIAAVILIVPFSAHASVFTFVNGLFTFNSGLFLFDPPVTAPVAAFSPLSLFTGAGGGWWDPSDLSTMWQDTSGTIPAVLNSPVARIDDKSGNGHNFTQSTSNMQPLLKQDGSGRYYLQFDGVNDVMGSSFTLAQPYTRIGTIAQNVWVSANGPRLFGSGSPNGGYLYQNPSPSPNIQMYAGANGCFNSGLAVATAGVVSEFFSGPSSSLTVNNGSPTTSCDPGGSSIGSPYVMGAGDATGVSPANMSVYGTLLIGRALTSPETANLRTWMGAKAGLSL